MGDFGGLLGFSRPFPGVSPIALISRVILERPADGFFQRARASAPAAGDFRSPSLPFCYRAESSLQAADPGPMEQATSPVDDDPATEGEG